MEELKKHFRKNGIFYSIVQRNDKVALLRHLGGKHWEVCRIYILPAFKVKGKTYTSKKVISNNNQFSRDGSRTFSDEKKALGYYKILSSKLNGSRSIEIYEMQEELSDSIAEVDKDINEQAIIAEIFLQDDTLFKKVKDINRIDNTSNKNGADFRLIRRNEKVALIGQYHYGRCIGFEVCKIHFHPEETILEKLYPIRESLPSNEDFGLDGSKSFFPNEFDRAESYFEELTLFLKMSIASYKKSGRGAMRLTTQPFELATYSKK